MHNQRSIICNTSITFVAFLATLPVSGTSGLAPHSGSVSDYASHGKSLVNSIMSDILGLSQANSAWLVPAEELH